MEGTRKGGVWGLVGNKSFKKEINFCEHKIFG
jgi:hypothetical protein